MLEAFLDAGLEKYSEDTLLTCKILENFEHPITKFLLYLHTMETFIYSDLK